LLVPLHPAKEAAIPRPARTTPTRFIQFMPVPIEGLSFAKETPGGTDRPSPNGIGESAELAPHAQKNPRPRTGFQP
jgi:hypothetical protein